MITLQDLAYVRIGTRDLDTQLEFAQEIVGLELVERRADTAFLRSDDRHHSLQFVSGEPRHMSSGFVLTDRRAVEDAARQLEEKGIDVHRGSPEECAERKVGAMISFRDTGKNTVELVCDQVNLTSRPVRFSRPAGITEFGHLGLEVPDVAAAQEFWCSNFSFQVSDWIGDSACLMRFNPVHHTLAVFKDSTGLGHVNFQVATIDDIMRSHNFLRHHGIEIVMGPGRHPQSTAVFLYFKGPEDVTWEYSHGVRLIPDDGTWVPRHFDVAQPDFIDMWRGSLAQAGTPWSERHA